MNVFLLVLRLVVGLIFVGHGAQKLFGWFGGHGLKGTAGFFESLGLKVPYAQALVAGLAEFAGGALLALGLDMPLAAFLIVAMMTSAILLVHLRKGLWNQNGGFEYPLVLGTIALTLAATGAGRYSIDHANGHGAISAYWTLVVLCAAVIAGALPSVTAHLRAWHTHEARPTLTS